MPKRSGKKRKVSSVPPHVTKSELALFRKIGFFKKNLHEAEPEGLSKASEVAFDRCQDLIYYAVLLNLRSVGPSIADMIWQVGIRSLEALKAANPVQMCETFEEVRAAKPDPCVEDTFRCAIAQVKYPDLADSCKDWWIWGEDRGDKEVASMPRGLRK